MDAQIKIKVPDKFFGYKGRFGDLDNFDRIVEKSIAEWAILNEIHIEPLYSELSFQFRNLNHALLFKLRMGAWEDSIVGFDPVLIPMIRRVMPALIANDIIGAQPMTGSSTLIHKLRARYSNDQTT